MMLGVRKRTWFAIGSVVAVLAAANLLFFYYPPDQIVASVGVENTYLTIFLIAAIGGVNTFTSGILYSSLYAFAAGGAEPLWLGIATGLGIAIGDTIMFTLFRYGFQNVGERAESYIERVRAWAERYPRAVQYVFVLLYLGISPFPSDILMALLAALGFWYREVVPLVIIGGISLATGLAYLGEQLPWG